jgi:UDP-N-acetylmuramoyl-tripeptide--D-alanyl-D-alanine ligase
VLNLLAAAACGAVVGIDEERIVRALEIVEAPPHRLARIENRATGITVIDDAYNSNPDGAAAALEILNTHTNGRRVLVTPGMVELGEQEKAANIAFGRTAARVCDFVILVGGELTEPIERGLKDGGLADDRIVHSPDVEHATRELSKIIRAGDIVLFENDLPDTYIDERREG